MPKEQHDKFHWDLQALWGARISKEQSAQFEKRLTANPFDREARAALIGYYSSGRVRSKSAARRRVQHILWVLENAPDCGIGTTPYLQIDKSEHPEDYERAKDLVLRQCERFKSDPNILMDMGSVLRYEDPKIAIQLLRQAHAITADKAHVAFWLSQTLHHIGQQSNNLDYLRESVTFMQEVVAAKKADRKFDARFWLAKRAYDSEQFDLAREVCNQMLADNSENYQSVHTAHIVLGSISFNDGDVASASEHLLLAGKVGESPRLVSYGPSMRLAQNLLDSGERETVTRYLTDCKKFWTMGKRELSLWIRQILAGENPQLQGDD